jgi:hypothetical protein
VPWLFWGQRAFQSPFAFLGLRFFPEVEHTVLGRPFLFNGLLNWPFAERVVRTPHQPFPVFLLLPLALVRTYGLALSAAAVVGALSLWRERRELAVLLALWCAPLLALLAVQENWNLEKTTYLLLALPPIALAAAAGLGAVLHRPVPELGRAAALALLLALLVRGAARLRFDADPRWYAAAASDSRAAHLRSAPEDARSLDALREAYTRPSPLPELPDQLSRPRLDAALARELEAATSGEGLFDDPCRRLMLELDQLQVVMDATAGATRLRSSLVLPDAPRALSAALRAIPTAGSAPGGAAIDLSTEPGGPCTVLDARVERRGRELEVRLEPMGAALCGVSCARPREAAPGQPQVGQRTVAFVVPPGIYRVRVLVAGEPAAEAELSVV